MDRQTPLPVPGNPPARKTAGPGTALLGKLVSAANPDPDEIDLSKRQAAFLQTEIERLDREFEERRSFFLRERRVRLGLGKD